MLFSRFLRGLAASAAALLAPLGFAQGTNLPVATGTLPNVSGLTATTPAPVDLTAFFGLDGINAATAQLVQFDSVLGRYNVVTTPTTSGTSNAATIANFLRYVDDGRYNNSIIHRSVDRFVIQGGGFTAAIPTRPIETFPAIALEYNLPNTRGTLSMARTAEPNSATSQWFVNTVDNTATLGPANSGGYAVFARVIGTGMTVIDAIAAVQVFNAGGVFAEIPLRDYTPPNLAVVANLVSYNTVRRIAVHPTPTVPGILTYTATSTNPAVVAPTLSGATLSLGTLGSAGSATVTVRATDTNGNFVERAFTITALPPSTPATRAVNISARAESRLDSDVLTPGFVLSGTGTKRVLIRAVGPTLASFEVPGAMANPRLTLFNPATNPPTILATNDDWGTAANAVQIAATAATVGAFPLPAGSLDAALLLDLAPGLYTAEAAGVDRTTGIALVEVYDADAGTPTARLINISTRAFVGTGASAVTPGFVVSGPGPKNYLIRAVGPTLSTFGVTGVLANPHLAVNRIVSGAGTVIASNDDWNNDAFVTSTGAQVGAFPLLASSRDAALVLSLAPGIYTVVVTGVGDTTGVALVELYEVP